MATAKTTNIIEITNKKRERPTQNRTPPHPFGVPIPNHDQPTNPYRVGSLYHAKLPFC